MCIYTVKKGFSIFPFPAGMSFTKLSLGGNNDVIYKLFPPRESLVSDIPAGDGNIEKHFYSVGCMVNYGVVFARSVSYMGRYNICCGIPVVVYLRGLTGSFFVV
jgi:hypothetical protein